MKVKELIEILKEQDQEHIVVMSKDGEGNDFSPFADIGVEMYVADSTWSGRLVPEDEWTDEAMKYKQNAIVLWPVN